MNRTLRFFPVALLLMLTPVLSFGQSKELTRIRVSYSSFGAASLSTWVAVDAGIFKTVLDQIKDKDPKARTTGYDSFIRTDLLREIEQSGFIKALAKG